jgi:hypothetical protein
VARVLVVWFCRVFKVGEDLVYGDAGEVRSEEFSFLLRVAVCSVGLVGGLDALLWGDCLLARCGKGSTEPPGGLEGG